MIGYLKGKILESTPGHWILGVGSEPTGFIGYEVAVPTHADYETSPVQQSKLYIYTHVREDALVLFGFKTKFEKDLFTTLLSVNGIGPKSALTILSSAGIDLLIEAIINGDQAALTRVPGVGKKTAERLVVELRDSLRKKLETGVLHRTQPKGVSDAVDSLAKNTQPRAAIVHSEMRDAREALMGLGVKEIDAQQLLNQIAKNHEGSAQWQASQWIKTALSELGNGTRV